MQIYSADRIERHFRDIEATMNIKKSSLLFRYANAMPFSGEIKDGCSLFVGCLASTAGFLWLTLMFGSILLAVGAFFQFIMGYGDVEFTFSNFIMTLLQGAISLGLLLGSLRVAFAVFRRVCTKITIVAE